MNSQKADLFIATNAKFFESHQIPLIIEKLDDMDDSKWTLLQTIGLKDPVISLILSLLGGGLGLDRFYIGDVGLGIAKLITCGGLGIWTIVDWFLIMPTTKQKNIDKIKMFI